MPNGPINSTSALINTLRPRQNGRHFADDTFKRIFMNENVRISINISLKFVPKGLINNIPALVQIMAWRRPGDKPLSEPMMVNLLTHICVTRLQWVKVITWTNEYQFSCGWYRYIKMFWWVCAYIASCPLLISFTFHYTPRSIHILFLSVVDTDTKTEGRHIGEFVITWFTGRCWITKF